MERFMVERLIAQLAHVEVITPKPEQSASFFKDILGLEESGRAGRSVYFGGWGEFFHHSLQLTEGSAPAIAHTAWRTEGPRELEACVESLDAAGCGMGWQEPTVGHGPAYRFRAPGGQIHEVFWESERYAAPPELAPRVPNRPQHYITRGSGARRIDHVTFNTDDPFRDAKGFQETLGFRLMEYANLDHADVVVTAFVSSTPMSHDLGLVLDAVNRPGKLSGMKGRANHVAFWVDSREDVLRTADLYVEAGLSIEYGPGKHGVGENLFLYVREPGGMRVELFSGGYMLYAPDIFPFEWKVSQGSLNVWNPNHMIPDGYLFEAFPPLAPDVAKTLALAGDYRV
jgi:catechol 2,3-dioxygenase